MNGLLAAIIVVCTSVFQFSLLPLADEADVVVMSQESVELSGRSYETSQKADNSTESQRSLCKIQAVSQGVQLQVAYTPIVWESYELELPDLQVEFPEQLYKSGWEYFRVLFTDIIAANAP